LAKIDDSTVGFLLLPISYGFVKTRRRTNLNRVEDTSPAESFGSFRTRKLYKLNAAGKEKEGFMKKLIQFAKSKSLTVAVAALISVALLPLAQAVVPAPDGGYPGFNTAEGQNALKNLTTGQGNTGVGWYSLFSASAANYNTAVGAGALVLNTADSNTALGAAALLLNTTGDSNTAVGTDALVDNTTGASNTANGAFALFTNSAGVANTATGAEALLSNTIGSFNTANGGGALLVNTTGNNNTAMGLSALAANTTGDGNTAVGRYALNSATGNGNTALGANAGSALTAGNFNIDIGVDVTGVAGESNTIRIGANLDETQGASACHIGGIYNQLVDPATASSMAIDATGKLGTAVSSRRFKHDIKPMDKASEAILALKPVTFHYKSDAKNTPCFGLIAEEVAGVNPALVVRNKKGEIWSVRYDQINAMLLNEFLKEHRKVQEQQTTIGQLKSNAAKQEATISELKKDLQIVVVRLKEQDSKIQSVSAELEMNKRSSHVVATNP
jgi:Chaperone of endosialidase